MCAILDAVITFDDVKEVAMTLPEVEASTKYDGSPVLKAGGVFLAGIATDESADADSLVVRMEIEDRQYLLEDAPRDLLTGSWRMAMKKGKNR